MLASRFGVGVPGQLLRRLDDRQEQVGVVVVGHAVDHAQDALQAHPGIDARRGQRHIPLAREIGIGLRAVELHEDQIPQFEEAVIFRLHQRDDAVDAQFRRLVPVDFAGRAAGARFRHLPEIGFRAHARDAARIDADVVDPDVIGFVVVLEDGERQPICAASRRLWSAACRRSEWRRA